MTDLVPYEGGVAPPSDAGVEWAWQSPSKYWTITRVQPTHQTGRRSNSHFSFLLIEFTHRQANGDRLVVEAYVDRKENLARLKGFLDTAMDLPQGIRIRVHTVEKVPWDDARGRR